MATIVTVHGTFANSDSDTGEKWWQHDSPFETHLKELLEADEGELKFEPFHWSGLNSETSRRSAGHHLFTKMKALDADGEPYSVIGHSHGGSVIATSLMESAKHKNPLSNLKQWLTIGTPFITTKKERLLFSRLGLWGKSAYVALLTTALMWLLTTDFDKLTAKALSDKTTLIGVIFFFLFILIPFWLFYFIMRYFNARKLHLYKPKTVAFADQGFRPRWLSLWHQNDEAVRGLSALKKMKLDVFHKDFAINPIALLSVFILPLLVIQLINSQSAMQSLHRTAVDSLGFRSGLAYVDDKVGNEIRLKGNGNSIRANVTFLLDFTTYGVLRAIGSKKNDEVTRALVGLLTVPIILLFLAFAITIVINYLAKIISAFLSRKLNPLTMGQLRATALGSDTQEDNAVDAADWPMWMGKGFPPLPDPLGPDLQATSDAAVSNAVPKFRSALGSFTAAKSSQEKSDMLSEYLTWEELIHTSYFNSAQFRKLVAYALAQSDGLHASEAFRRDEDFELIASLYAQLSSQPALS